MEPEAVEGFLTYGAGLTCTLKLSLRTHVEVEELEELAAMDVS